MLLRNVLMRLASTCDLENCECKDTFVGKRLCNQPSYVENHVPETVYIGRFVLLKCIQKKSVGRNEGVFILNMRGFLQHGSFQSDQISLIFMSKIAKKRHRVMGGLYMNILCTINCFILKGN